MGFYDIAKGGSAFIGWALFTFHSHFAAKKIFLSTSEVTRRNFVIRTNGIGTVLIGKYGENSDIVQTRDIYFPQRGGWAEL